MTWEQQLAELLVKYNYSENLEAALKYAREECWQIFKEDGYTPKQAIDEDISCAD